jgi:hypothetical protein
LLLSQNKSARAKREKTLNIFDFFSHLSAFGAGK